jgi:O-antigen/teichoic acid export membrane protein
MFLALLVLPLGLNLKLLSLVMGLGYLLLLHSVGYVAVLGAVEDMEFNSIGFVLQRVVLVILVFTALKLGWGLWGVVWSYFLANFFQWIFYHVLVTKRYTGGRMHRDLALWKSLVWEALPMGGGMALRQLAWQLDIFLLKCLSDPISLGLFSGPFRILTGMTLLPAAFTISLFPLLVRLAQDSRAQFSEVYQRIVKWYCVASFPILIGGLAWPATWIKLFIGEKYLPAAPALQTLSVAVIPVFLSILYPFVFSALHIQKWYFMVMSAGVAVRLLSGWYIIPRYGFLGEAVVIVATEMAMFFSLSTYLYYIGQPSDLKQNFLKPALASVVPFLLLFRAQAAPLPWMAAAAVAAAAAYLAGLYFLRIFTSQELALVREAGGFVEAYRLRLRAGKGPVV